MMGAPMSSDQPRAPSESEIEAMERSPDPDACAEGLMAILEAHQEPTIGFWRKHLPRGS